ncbi:MAG: GNAT family N-acetyltransferase [Hyphomicrobiaceae bacterium]
MADKTSGKAGAGKAGGKAGEPGAVVRIEPRIADIAAADWDAMANPPGVAHDPFISHAFLKALEDASTVGPRTGWVPQHLVLEDAPVAGGQAKAPGETAPVAGGQAKAPVETAPVAGGQAKAPANAIKGVMPCYVKSHSKGEYIFDYGWAEAYERAGGRYYPKLQTAVPFTPVPGRRLLVVPDASQALRERQLLAGGIELAKRVGASSLHLTFLTEGEWQRSGEAGLLQRTDKQFHWHNQGYKTFEDFLSSLASRKRKAIRKERRDAVEGGLVIERVTGKAITEAHWDAFFQFYMDTGSRKWGRPYLNRAFFSHLGTSMPERCLLVMVRRGDSYIAGALNLIGGDCLYGRYWGTIDPQPCLHFEVCYYQAIEYAIEHGLARVEAGAQGEHKLARGYIPQATYSVHWIGDEGFRSAVARYLDDERQHMESHRAALAEYAPYRKGDAPPEVE